MRLSEFRALMEQEFGRGYAASVAAGHHLHALRDRTPDQAIEDGVKPRAVWEALCDDMDVPEERRFLADARDRTRRPR